MQYWNWYTSLINNLSSSVFSVYKLELHITTRALEGMLESYLYCNFTEIQGQGNGKLYPPQAIKKWPGKHFIRRLLNPNSDSAFIVVNRSVGRWPFVQFFCEDGMQFEKNNVFTYFHFWSIGYNISGCRKEENSY